MASVCSAKTSHLPPRLSLAIPVPLPGTFRAFPDCSHLEPDHVAAPAPPPGDLVSVIRAILSDTSLTEEEKAKKCQELVGGSSKPSGDKKNNGNGGIDIFNGSLNKLQSLDQKFENMNEALRLSCKKGYLVRVVCDLCGDRPRPLPEIEELKGAIDITERKGAPSWDYDEEKGCWL